MRGHNIGLALQGGGSYAAFTAGVLRSLLHPRRRFLDHQRVRSISGTSGGALNALLLGEALHEGNHEPAQYVRRLWQLNRLEKHLRQHFKSLQLVPESFIAALVGMGRELMSAQPSLTQGFGDNAQLKDMALEMVNDMLHEAAPTLTEDLNRPVLPNAKPFVTVAATEVHSGMAHYFTNNQAMIDQYQRFEIARARQVLRPLTLNGVFASIAHPAAFNPVVIDDNQYWDGYFTCNPPFVYLFREGCDEVLLIRLVQQERDSVGDSKTEVSDRMEEIVQNSALNMEILTYLAMRELLVANPELDGTAELKLAQEPLRASSLFHEIRLRKPGHISDEGFPLNELVETLLELGRKAVADRQGFVRAYDKSPAGHQIITEVDFDDRHVQSRSVDIDRVLFHEQTLGDLITEAGGRRHLMDRLLGLFRRRDTEGGE